MVKKFRLLLLLLICAGGLFGQDKLPRSSPEKQGVSSAAIIEFLKAADASPFEFHSFVLIKNGFVIAEGWWSPYSKDLRHTMYSVTKSFTSTAMGFAVDEGLLSVDERVLSFFPGITVNDSDSLLAAMRIKDLLTMTAGQDPPNYPVGDDWETAFLTQPVVHIPGSKFAYNSIASHMISAIVQGRTGKKIREYLEPRLFSPLGISDFSWLESPGGVSTGGWGLRLQTEDMAKFGLLLLNQGKWKGQQLISSSWVDEATARQVDSWPAWLPEGISRDSSDWNQGYGYQFWRNRGGSYRADGAFGQLILVMPKENAVLAVTAGGNSMQEEMNLIHRHLIPALGNSNILKRSSATRALKKVQNSLKLPLPARSWKGSSALKYGGKSYHFEEPGEVYGFDFSNQELLKVRIKKDSARFQLSFSNGDWFLGKTFRPAPEMNALPASSQEEIYPTAYAGAFTWIDEKTLELTLRYTETPFVEKFRFRFEAEQLLMEKSGTLQSAETGKAFIGKPLEN